MMHFNDWGDLSRRVGSLEDKLASIQYDVVDLSQRVEQLEVDVKIMREIIGSLQSHIAALRGYADED